MDKIERVAEMVRAATKERLGDDPELEEAKRNAPSRLDTSKPVETVKEPVEEQEPEPKQLEDQEKVPEQQPKKRKKRKRKPKSEGDTDVDDYDDGYQPILPYREWEKKFVNKPREPDLSKHCYLRNPAYITFYRGERVSVRRTCSCIWVTVWLLGRLSTG